MRLDQITMSRFSAELERTRTVVQPFGALEEHGPHLPLGTDTLQVEAVCDRAAGQANVFAAPAVPFGVCRSTGDHPGTVGITTPVLRSLAIDLGRGYHRQGLRSLLFVTGHAGKTHTLTLVDAGEALIEEFADMRVAVVSEYNEVRRVGADIYETPDDSHAGEIETSRILHLFPALVDGSAPEEYPEFPPHLIVRNKMRYWPGGVWGNPSKASPDKGSLLMERAVENLVCIIRSLESSEE